MKKHYFLAIILLFSLHSCSLLAQINLKNGLVAQYSFTGNSQDDSGNGNHAKVQGAVLTTDRFGHCNRAYYFDGKDDYITVPNSNALSNFRNEMTMAAWVYIESFYSNSVGSYAAILCKSTTSNIQYRIVLLPDRFSTTFNGENSNLNTPFALNRWYFLTVAVRNSEYRFYVNGVFLGSSGVSSGVGNAPNADLEIGRDIHNITEYHKGKIDDIRLYNRVLSDQEIKTLYEMPAEEVKNPLEILASDTIINCDISKTIELKASGADTYVWKVENQTLAEGATITVNPKETTFYTVVGKTSGGCEYKRTIKITVIPCPVNVNLFIPNVITPNQDGKNDTFLIKNLEKFNHKIEIYNRWNSLVFQSQNYQNDWRGEDLTGGVYYYLLVLTDLQKTYKGWVQVLK